MKEDFKYDSWEQLCNMKTDAEHFIENIFTCTIFLLGFFFLIFSQMVYTSSLS